jgi:hypothetical protein
MSDNEGNMVARDEERALNAPWKWTRPRIHPKPPQTVYSINAGREIPTYFQDYKQGEGDGVWR